MFRVGYYQFRPRFAEPRANCDRVLRRLAEVEADVIVLPELPFTGYLFRDRRELASMAEQPRESSLVDDLVALCRERDLLLVTGFAEKSDHRVFNSSLLLGPRGILRTYRKIHLFNKEKRWFDPGDLAFEVDRVRGVRVGMMICFDWVFPEAARALALGGADLLAHPSNLVLDYCQRVMTARCIENGVFAVTANRFGEDRRPHDRVRFTGRSQVAGPRGDVIRRAPSQREELFLCDIDPRDARDKKITPANHLLRDRRPEFYPPTVPGLRRRRRPQ
jgi:predicted amidohydrolase